jgi:hypothetical protein
MEKLPLAVDTEVAWAVGPNRATIERARFSTGTSFSN